MTFQELRAEFSRLDNIGVPRYVIRAKTGSGGTLTLFTYRGSPEDGIAKAKSEAAAFGQTDLYDFTAEKASA